MEEKEHRYILKDQIRNLTPPFQTTLMAYILAQSTPTKPSSAQLCSTGQFEDIRVENSWHKLIDDDHHHNSIISAQLSQKISSGKRIIVENTSLLQRKCSFEVSILQLIYHYVYPTILHNKKGWKNMEIQFNIMNMESKYILYFLMMLHYILTEFFKKSSFENCKLTKIICTILQDFKRHNLRDSGF